MGARADISLLPLNPFPKEWHPPSTPNTSSRTPSSLASRRGGENPWVRVPGQGPRVPPQGPAATRGCCSPAQRSAARGTRRPGGEPPSRCSAPHPAGSLAPIRGLAPTCEAGDVSQFSPTAGLENARWKKFSRCQLHPLVPERSRKAPLSSPEDFLLGCPCL